MPKAEFLTFLHTLFLPQFCPPWVTLAPFLSLRTKTLEFSWLFPFYITFYMQLVSQSYLPCLQNISEFNHVFPTPSPHPGLRHHHLSSEILNNLLTSFPVSSLVFLISILKSAARMLLLKYRSDNVTLLCSKPSNSFPSQSKSQSCPPPHLPPHTPCYLSDLSHCSVPATWGIALSQGLCVCRSPHFLNSHLLGSLLHFLLISTQKLFPPWGLRISLLGLP